MSFPYWKIQKQFWLVHLRGSTVLNLASGLGRDWKCESNINVISHFVTYVKCNFCEWQFQWFCGILNLNFANFNVILHEITKITELGKNWKSQPITKVKCDSMKCQKLIFRVDSLEVEYTDTSLVLISHVVTLWNSNYHKLALLPAGCDFFSHSFEWGF